MRIFKFGGASVKNAEGVINLVNIVKRDLAPGDVIVISAMGKSTVALEEIARLRWQSKAFHRHFRDLQHYHQEIIHSLGFGTSSIISEEVAILFGHLEHTLKEHRGENYKMFTDSVMAYGELLSTKIVAEHLKSEKFPVEWVDVRDMIFTDKTFSEAKVDWVITQKLLRQRLVGSNSLHVTQGFIGRSSSGETTTLGKEGSDFTAAIIASCCKAESVTIWKDVPGVLSADPKWMKEAVLYPYLSFQEAAEMTYYGAKVIHPKTIRPLADKDIPLYIRSFIDNDQSGTVIDSSEKPHKIPPCFIFKTEQVLFSLATLDLSFVDERKLTLIFQALDTLNISINLMQNSAVTLSICFDTDHEKMYLLRKMLGSHFKIYHNEGLTLATIKNYDDDSLAYLTQNKEVYVEQRTRQNVHVLFRSV